MTTETISIEVDSQTAREFAAGWTGLDQREAPVLES